MINTTKGLRCLAGAVSALALVCSLDAQVIVIPDLGKSPTANSNSSYPWNRKSASIRIQQIYDTTNFTAAVNPVNGPILINRLRFRAADATTTATKWTGGTYGAITIKMSSAAVDYNALTTTFSSNHGTDMATVYSGAVKLTAGAGTGAGVPGPWYVDVTLKTPFPYHPGQGKDLLIDIASDGSKWTPATGTATTNAVTMGATWKAYRMYNLLSHTATTGGAPGNVGLVLEINYTAVTGLVAGFTAAPTTGPQNLKVTFKDTSFSSDPGGITSWAWDFDGDKKVDSTLQNPTFTYKCGKFSPSLTVTDKTHPAATKTRTDLIRVALVKADFGVSGTSVGFAPLRVTFTDKSSAGVVARQWDLDGDGKIDSTRKKPRFTYTKPGIYDVSLNVIGPCTQDKITKKGLIVVPAVKDKTTPDILQYQFNDVRTATAPALVANTASGTAAPAVGTMSATKWQGDPGRARFNANESGYGMVAAGASRTVDTGWPLQAKSMTIMFWLRKSSAVVAPFGYCFGKRSTTTQLRCFLSGAAGNAVLFRGSSIGDFSSGNDVQTGKRGVWQHLCLVVDNVAGKATWYVDGVASNTKTFTANSFNETDTGFTVGAVGTATSPLSNNYDYDDFRFYSTALTATQVAAAMAEENAATNTFGTACSSVVAGEPKIAANGLPTQGNAGFRVDVTGTEANAPGAMLVSLNAASGGLPLDISPQTLPGCRLEVLPVVTFFGATTGTGTFSQPLPIPVDPVPLAGFHVYCQFGYLGKIRTGITKGLDINVH
ncbi:MAG: PKD domain-containing protein [Planctomycetota bacterium]